MGKPQYSTKELGRWIDRVKKFNLSDEIMAKVRDIEDSLTPFDRCINALICPRCGGKLTFTRFSRFSDVVFECPRPCKFIYKKKWEEYDEKSV